MSIQTAASTVSSKGQVTVPLAIRRRLGLKAGDRVEFAVEDGKTVLRPGRDAENPFLKYVGKLPYFRSMEEIDAWVREMRDEADDPETAKLLRQVAEREKSSEREEDSSR